MAEGEDVDITAEAMASMGGRRSFNRAISLEFSAKESQEMAEYDDRRPQDELQRDGGAHKQMSTRTCDHDKSDSGDTSDSTDDGSKIIGTTDDPEFFEVRYEDRQGNSHSETPRVKHKRNRKRKHAQERRIQKQFLSSLSEQTSTSVGPQGNRPEEPLHTPLAHSVPSLVELCLEKSVRATGISEKAGSTCATIAPGIQVLLSAHQNQRQLEQAQLKWLLEAIEQGEAYLRYNMIEFMDHHGKKGQFFVRGCLSLFDSNRYARMLGRNVHEKTKSQVSLAIFAGGCDYSDWAIIPMVHCINLLLPSHLPEKESKDALTPIVRVRRFLNKHSSTVVNHCFDIALAYVFWARGDIEEAKNTMLKICNRVPVHSDVKMDPGSEKVFVSSTLFDQQRSLYLCEISRMLSHFDQRDEAMHFYRQAVDVINEGSSVARDRLVLQSFALNASLYDQGLMGQSLADTAAVFWDMVTTDRNCQESLIQGSLESFLHCHVGFLLYGVADESLSDGQKNESWLRQAKSRIERVMGKAPQVHIHHSLVLAMLGESQPAEVAYSRFIQEYAENTEHYTMGQVGSMPGRLACSFQGALKIQPWWILLEWIVSRSEIAGSVVRRCLPVVPLLWRRMLKNPHYGSDVDLQTFEVEGKPLNLHLTHDGYLSGSFMYNLPPWKSVLFDPYTGSICIPDPHRVEEMQCFQGNHPYCRTSTYFDVNTFIPVPVVLFQDAETQSEVTLLIVGSNANFRKDRISFYDDGGVYPKDANTTCTLRYSKGRAVVELNLRKLVVDVIRTNILQHTRETTRGRNKKVLTDVQRLLDLCVLNGLQLDFSLVQNLTDGSADALIEAIQKYNGRQGIPTTKTDEDGEKKGMPVKIPLHQALQLKEVLYVGKSTVILCFYTAVCPPDLDHMSSVCKDTLVFLDCSSSKTFSNPVIYSAEAPRTTWVLPNQKSCWKARGSQQHVFFAYKATCLPSESEEGRYKLESRALIVFNEHGSIIHRHGINELRMPYTSTQMYEACSGWLLLGRYRTTTSLRGLDVRSMSKVTVKTQAIEEMVVEQDMVFVSRANSVVALDTVSLQPLPVQKTGPNGDLEIFKDNGVLIEDECRSLCILASNDFLKTRDGTNKGTPFTRVILGVLNHVVVLERQKPSEELTSGSLRPIEVVALIVVPGLPTEAYYISKHAGIVVTASLFKFTWSDPYSRDNMYWFSSTGAIRGIHPILGIGPHGFTAISLPTNKGKPAYVQKTKILDAETGGDEKRWHLYFTDGLGALCCIRLDVNDPILHYG